ncbi:MAG: porin, partial [Burkholderiaceae bacterium]|nr:porin [Burkholderiaceae bacterium]
MFVYKALFAAFILAATSVYAQSTVKLSGIVDQGFAIGNGGTAANPGGNGTNDKLQVKQAASSRFVFQGTEDLGGGMAADFILDARFTPDDGNVSSTFFSGRSLLSLKSAKYGSLYFGREYTPAFWVGLLTDPFMFEGVGQLGLMKYAGFLDTAGVRTNNTVGYLSPRVEGLTIRLASSLGEDAVGTENGVALEFNNGKAYASVAYQKISGGPAPTSGNSILNIGASYDLNEIKPMVYYAKIKTSNGSISSTSFSIGATAPLGLGRLKVAYGLIHS